MNLSDRKNVFVAATKGLIAFYNWTDLEHTMNSNIETYTFRLSYGTYIPPNKVQLVTTQWMHSYTTVQNGYVVEQAKTDSARMHLRTVNTLYSKNPLNAHYTISDATLSTSGNYIFNVTALDAVDNKTFVLHVKSPPTVLSLVSLVNFPNVTIDPQYLELSKYYNVWCIGEGYPTPTPTMWWKPCVISAGETCDDWIKLPTRNRLVSDTNVLNTTLKFYTYQIAVAALTKATTSGTYRCTIDESNDESSVSYIQYIVTDIPDAQKKQGFGIQPVPDQTDFYQFTDVSLSCRMQKYINFTDLHWYYMMKSNGEYQKIDITHSGYVISWNKTNPYSNDFVLTIDRIAMNQSGTYKCQGQRITRDSTVQNYDTIQISVIGSTKPYLGPNSSPSSPDTIKANYSSEVTIICDAQGIPDPTITWFFDDYPFNARTGITIENNNTEIKITRTLSGDQGTYKCSMTNVAGRTDAEFLLKIEGVPDPESKKLSKTGIIILASCLAFLTTSVIILLCFVVYLKRRDKQRVYYLF